MALSFPLAQEAFFAGLRVSECTFYPPANLTVSRTRGGTILTARLGERLWTGQIVVPVRRQAEAAGIAAMISVLSESGRSFLAHPRPLWAPIADPGGLLLGNASPTISSLPAGGRELRITGLPAGYVLTRGDFIGFSYGSDPVRYALHQIVTGGAANGSGLTPLLEVTPPIRPGAVTGTAASLVRPAIKAILMPGNPGRAGIATTDGITLDFVQTLR